MEAGSLLQEALLRQAERHELADVDHDSLWLDVHVLPSDETEIQVLLRLAALAKELNAFFQTQRYQWHMGGDGPVFGIHGSEQIPHLRAICRYGANVADEWTAVELVRQFTEQSSQIAVECWDVQDGQILLIESANVLPSWVDDVGPEAMRHRCWVQNGQIQLLPVAPTNSNSSTNNQTHNLGLQEALKTLQKGGSQVQNPGRVQEAIRDCVARFVPSYILSKSQQPDKAKTASTHEHKAVIALPRPVAYLIHRRPDLVNAAIIAFATYTLQPELKTIQKKKSKNPSSKSSTTQTTSTTSTSSSIECEDWVFTTHNFSRTNYAMLRTLVSAHAWKTETTVPKAYQSVELRRIQRQCAVEATPHLCHAVHIGVRLVAGFNELLHVATLQSSSTERRVLHYWPRLLRELWGMESATWLLDAWRMGPNHAVHDISNIMQCPVVAEELVGENICPLSHPDTSLAAQIQRELKKVDSEQLDFVVPRQDEVDPNEDWMLFTVETMEKQVRGTLLVDPNDNDSAASKTTRQDEEKEQAAQLDTMLNAVQDFMGDKSGPEGVSYDKQKVSRTDATAADDNDDIPVEIQPRVFLNLLKTVLDPSTTTNDIVFPVGKATSLDGDGNDEFFSGDDYQAMLPDEGEDDDESNDAVDTDVVELMAAMDAELKGTAAASVAVDSEALNDAGVLLGTDNDSGEESRLLLNLLQSLDAGSGGPGPVRSMMNAMGQEPPLLVTSDDGELKQGSESNGDQGG
ncbi:Protein ecdysoneless homolog [Seminavis robusta]|uniref:Protein ecdysoneless homolog n=1 Tax=Seminavis robusta TaxID=568900 RepID=A0A9N8HLQ0_9STRA|nr:Protein ecdysoneless homolog [Seminavis robusta]|eukprot:Sro829_g208060.1 Protein ecdysoneless homolog (744) ;mRNA; r:6784-9090